MAVKAPAKSTAKALAIQQPTPSEDEKSSRDVDLILDGEIDKDDDEKELERLVFGDETGLKEGLKGFSLLDEEEDITEEQDGLQGLADADLFFTDDGVSSDAQQGNLAVQPLPHRYETQAAWEDSEDERIMVSLATVPRLRKLRLTEAEDVVDGVEYSRRLRQQFELLNPQPQWAAQARARATKRRRISQGADDLEAEFADNSDDDDLPSAPPLASLLQDASSLMRGTSDARGKKRKLRPETITIQRTKDIAGTQPSAVTSLSFHLSYPLLLSSGPSSTLYMHHIASSPPAPVANPLLISLHIRGTPLTTTAFCPGDSRIFLSARRKYFHVWNLDSGQVEKVSQVAGQQHEQKSMERFKMSPNGEYMALLGTSKKNGGTVNILLASTLQWVAQARVESRGGIADFAWWRDSKGLAIVGKNGEISEWSVDQQKIVARWQDEGAVGSTVLALGGQHEFVKSAVGTDRWIAVGSSSGIVNLYDRRALLSGQAKDADQPLPLRPKPFKTFDHITVPISQLVFSPDGQLLAMASKWKRDALRLIHLPSATVYKNWPTSSTPLGTITAVAIADGEIAGNNIHSLLAVANEQGKIRLWEIS